MNEAVPFAAAFIVAKNAVKHPYRMPHGVLIFHFRKASADGMHHFHPHSQGVHYPIERGNAWNNQPLFNP